MKVEQEQNKLENKDEWVLVMLTSVITNEQMVAVN